MTTIRDTVRELTKGLDDWDDERFELAVDIAQKLSKAAYEESVGAEVGRRVAELKLAAEYITAAELVCEAVCQTHGATLNRMGVEPPKKTGRRPKKASG